MITDANRKVSIIAYFISKFDMDAVKALGYGTYTDAFEALSKRFGKTNHYMRFRRDEFDPVIGKTNRHGFNMRNPRAGVLVLHNDLKNYTFEELSAIVNDLLIDDESKTNESVITESDKKIITEFSEEEYERILNMSDTKAAIRSTVRAVNVRVLNNKIQNTLKNLYHHRCQICGATAEVMYGVDVSEAHHIEYFTKSLNNNPSNIIILCPDHHRIVHKAKGIIDYETHCFMYENAKVDTLMYNLHL